MINRGKTEVYNKHFGWCRPQLILRSRRQLFLFYFICCQLSKKKKPQHCFPFEALGSWECSFFMCAFAIASEFWGWCLWKQSRKNSIHTQYHFFTLRPALPTAHSISLSTTSSLRVPQSTSLPSTSIQLLDISSSLYTTSIYISICELDLSSLRQAAKSLLSTHFVSDITTNPSTLSKNE